MTIAVDLDGVVHGYSRGWRGGELYDLPVPGAIEALKHLIKTEPTFIFTARRDTEAVARWLWSHGVPAVESRHDDDNVDFWTKTGVLLVTNRKLPARLYVDDRALLFTGDWDVTLARIASQPIGGPVVDPLAATYAVVRELHQRDALGFCGTCFGAFDVDDADGNEYARSPWPCPTLRAFSPVGDDT